MRSEVCISEQTRPVLMLYYSWPGCLRCSKEGVCEIRL